MNLLDTNNLFKASIVLIIMFRLGISTAHQVERLEVRFEENLNHWILKTTPSDQPVQTLKVPVHKGYELIGGPLFSNFGLVFLITPHMPKIIHINFPMLKPAQKLIDSMYAFEGLEPPEIIGPDSIEALNFEELNFKSLLPARSTSLQRSVIAYSSGKNSIWNYLQASMDLGAKNVLPIHLHGLNRAVSQAEMAAFEQQIENFPIPNWKILPISNSTLNRGSNLLKSRDLFIIGTLLSYAVEFEASDIRTEGAANESSDHFGDQLSTFDLLNQVIHELGLDIDLITTPETEISLNRKLYVQRPEWMKHLNNCYTPKVYGPTYRKNWQLQSPGVFKGFSEYQCGSCVKCRMSILALIDENQDFLNQLSDEDLNYFIANTRRWLKKHEAAKDLEDFLIPEVYETLNSIIRKFEERKASLNVNQCESFLTELNEH